MLVQFPCRIRGFHSDNGSEFMNYTVQWLLNKLALDMQRAKHQLMHRIAELSA